MGVPRKCENLPCGQSWHWPGGGGVLFPGMKCALRPERRALNSRILGIWGQPTAIMACPAFSLPLPP